MATDDIRGREGLPLWAKGFPSVRGPREILAVGVSGLEIEGSGAVSRAERTDVHLDS